MHSRRSAPLFGPVMTGVALGLCLLAAFGGTTVAAAADPAAYAAKSEEFPPADAGVDLAGELVTVDHVNRRGGLRLDGDFNEDRYHSAPTFSFILMPYGEVFFHGAPADLHDIPLGTRLHGRFVLPPEGDTAIATPPPQHAKYVPPQNRAIRLEDDVSHAVRTGRAWKLRSFDREKGDLTVVAVTTAGEPVADAKPVVYSVDGSTRIWQGNGFGTLDDLAAAAAAGTAVQLNLTWHPGWENRNFHSSDIWLDEASRTAATARQREIHVRRMKHYWLPARIDRVDHTGGGNGVLTVTLLGGFDPSLYEAFFDNGGVPGKMSTGVTIAAAEPTLRTWWQNHDTSYGQVQKRRTIENPPLGSSGVELDISTPVLLEGFRPGRFVRIGSQTSGWPRSKPPPEWRIKSIEERERALYGDPKTP